MAILRANFGWYASMALGLAYESGSQSWITGTSADNRLQIYSGTMPGDANDFSVSGSPLGFQDGSPSATLLATFTNFQIDVHDEPSADPTLDVQEVVFDTDFAPYPGTVNAIASGTASWWAMWNVTEVAATDPITGLPWGALLGDVSLSGGNGSCHLDSLSLLSGQPVQLLHWGVRFQA